MARNYFILLISFLGAVALADYAIVTGLVNFQTTAEKPQSPDSGVLYKLAQKYEAGVEVDLDMDKAIYWYQVAAENGSEEATTRLATLNIPLNKPSTSMKDSGNIGTKDSNIDQEAEKITKLLEQQLAREEEKAKKAKQKTTQKNTIELEHRLTEEKKMAERIRQIEEAKIQDMDQTESANQFSPDSSKEVAIIESQPADVFDEDDIDTSEAIAKEQDSKNIVTNNKPISVINQVPLALQPNRPVNLPSTQKRTSPSLLDYDAEYITAYDEEADNSIDEEEFSESGNTNVSSEPDATEAKIEGEKKEFNVNPCNGPAAKFMSTCR